MSSYASQAGPFRFRSTGDKLKSKPLSGAQRRANLIDARERKNIEWEKKMELQRIENPIIYEIVPSSTAGFVHLHRVTATRGVITSDTWETVPDDHLKVDLYRVRMADNPSPLPSLMAATTYGSTRLEQKETETTSITEEPQLYTVMNQPVVPSLDQDAMDIDMD